MTALIQGGPSLARSIPRRTSSAVSTLSPIPARRPSSPEAQASSDATSSLFLDDPPAAVPAATAAAAAAAAATHPRQQLYGWLRSDTRRSRVTVRRGAGNCDTRRVGEGRTENDGTAARVKQRAEGGSGEYSRKMDGPHDHAVETLRGATGH